MASHWDHFTLPDALTLPLIPAGLFVTALIEPERLADHAIGAAAGRDTRATAKRIGIY